MLRGAHHGPLHAAAQRLALDFALRQIVDAFNQRGVRSLLLKGPAFARWLYNDPSQRLYRDIDLLVDPDRFEMAERALIELGFEPLLTSAHPSERAPHHETWVRSRPMPAAVELHHTLALVSAPPSLVWERFSQGAGRIEVAGAPVDVPSESVCALIAALHCAQHGIGDARHMGDLHRALERVDPPTWRATAVLAHELGADEAFAVGLRLSSSGGRLADLLGLPETASRFVRLRASSPPDTTAGIERLITTPGMGARLRLIAHELMPSRGWMRLSYPLARRSRRGLALAYVCRPFLLIVKLPRGLTAWLRLATMRNGQLAPPDERP